jgi:hypothetical protein
MTNLTHTLSVYLYHAFTCFKQQVLIIRRTNLCQYIIWCNTLWWVSVWRAGQEETACCLKHAEALYKYIAKVCVKLVINQNYVEMQGQQNIKF